MTDLQQPRLLELAQELKRYHSPEIIRGILAARGITLPEAEFDDFLFKVAEARKVKPAESPPEPPAEQQDAVPFGEPEPSRALRKQLPKVAYAIAYARRGIPVFPCHNIDPDRECSCGKLKCDSAGKHPRHKGWQGEATTDETQIRAWWAETPEANIGVRCGEQANLTVLDVDGDAGRDTLRGLELEHGELPETPMTITGRGGNHYYFSYESGLGNDVNFAKDKGGGLDIRTQGGLVIGVGSKTQGSYEWEVGYEISDTFQPAKMPGWLVALIKAAGAHDNANGKALQVSGKALVEGEGRNHELYKVGRSNKARGFSQPAHAASLKALNATYKEPVAADELNEIIEHTWTQADRKDFQAPAVSNGNGRSEPTVKPLPPPMKAGEWFREETERFANTSFIWDGILEDGAYAMIGGKKGHGKSTFGRTLAFKISRGEDFMGRATVRSRVWYIDLEPGGKGRVDLLRSLGWCDDDWLEFSTIPPPANHPDVFKWLRRYIVERGFKVIIVDTLFKLVRIDGANDYDKALYAQIELEEICRELNVCVIVLHHARKNGQFSSLQSCAEQMLGATSIAGAACACILINHRGGVYTFRMDPPRYGKAIEGELVLGRDNQGFVSESGTWKRQWVSQTKDLVLAAATEQEGWFVARDLQVTEPERGETLKRSSLYWALGELVKDNRLEKGDPLPAGKRGGRPVDQYRVKGRASNAETAQAQENLWSRSERENSPQNQTSTSQPLKRLSDPDDLDEYGISRSK